MASPRILLSILSLTFLLFACESNAQLTGPSSSSTPLGTSIGTSGAEAFEQKMQMEASIFNDAVDPLTYRMGPGDLLSIRLYTTIPILAVVSPEQTLIVPRIGEFNVAGRTLAEIKSEILNRSDTVFPSARRSGVTGAISISLLQPRKVLVKVIGEVPSPGIYTFTGAMRADAAIAYASKQAVQTTLFADEALRRELDRRKREADKLRPYLGSESTKLTSDRHIVVTHSDGTQEQIDLLRYNATKEGRFCPYLREGDVIYVPFKRSVYGTVGLYGAVKAPGEYEYVPGDSLYAMIRNVFGFGPGADMARVELVRRSPAGVDYATQIVDATKIMANPSLDVPLNSGDRIFVRGEQQVEPLSVVVLKGEVKQEGVYPIQRGVTTLSELVNKAGGFTSEAFLAGANITRNKSNATNRELTPEDEALQVSRLANLDVYDTANFRLQTRIREGNVSVDMNRLFVQGDKSADVMLSDGDVITIPSQPHTVYVWGYSGSVGYVPYREGAPVDYYIKSAGGYAEGAVKSRTRVIKSGSKKWVKPKETTVQAGDEIYVFKEGDYSEDYSLRVAANIAGIIGGLATVFFGLYSIFRR